MSLFFHSLTIYLVLIDLSDCKKSYDTIELDEEVGTKNITELKGYRLELVCEEPEIVEKVAWYKNARIMVPVFVKKQTKNRVMVKPEHQRIEFTSLRPSDSGMYTCVNADGTQVSHHNVTVETVTSLVDMRSPVSWMFWTTIISTVVFTAICSFSYSKT